MRVLTVYANSSPQSFCHAVLERFSAGLADAGHDNEVVDLYAIEFDPVPMCWGANSDSACAVGKTITFAKRGGPAPHECFAVVRDLVDLAL